MCDRALDRLVLDCHVMVEILPEGPPVSSPPLVVRHEGQADVVPGAKVLTLERILESMRTRKMASHLQQWTLGTIRRIRGLLFEIFKDKVGIIENDERLPRNMEVHDVACNVVISS